MPPPDLAPPPPISTFGDTIVASNPFDDTPPSSKPMDENFLKASHLLKENMFFLNSVSKRYDESCAASSTSCNAK